MSLPLWCSKFVGQPYKDDNNGGYDCWGLVRAVYKHAYNIDVANWSIEVTKGCWRLVATNPIEGDLLVFSPDGIQHHVGLVADAGRMIHASEGTGQILIEPYTVTIWRLQHKQTYRHDLL